jgi:hypothetical protein
MPNHLGASLRYIDKLRDSPAEIWFGVDGLAESESEENNHWIAAVKLQFFLDCPRLEDEGSHLAACIAVLEPYQW